MMAFRFIFILEAIAAVCAFVLFFLLVGTKRGKELRIGV